MGIWGLHHRRRLVSGIMAVVFAVTSAGTSCAQGVADLPAPGSMVALSAPYHPPVLAGMKIHPDDPFRFDFILDKGDMGHGVETQNFASLREDSTRLIKYFLAALTVPEKDLWVNLSPYEKDHIVPDAFGQTEMGRDLLAQDYLLKQITASIIYPEDEVGKKFWKKVYAKAYERYGTTDIPVDTFNKVWIIPQKAIVYENAQAGTAYVVESSVKVMLEGDYLALEKNSNQTGATITESTHNETQELARDVIREVVIPELEKEVNEGRNFAKLRQVYQSLILAAWFKKKITGSILSKVYVDQKKVAGVNIDNPEISKEIWAQYVTAFKKGAYKYIKEEVDPLTQETIPRKYFSGGVVLKFGDFVMTTTSDSNSIFTKVTAGFIKGLVSIAIVLSMSSGQAQASPQKDENTKQQTVSNSDTGGIYQETKKLRSLLGELTGPETEKAIKAAQQLNLMAGSNDSVNMKPKFLNNGADYDDVEAFLKGFLRRPNLSQEQRRQVLQYMEMYQEDRGIDLMMSLMAAGILGGGLLGSLALGSRKLIKMVVRRSPAKYGRMLFMICNNNSVLTTHYDVVFQVIPENIISDIFNS